MVDLVNDLLQANGYEDWECLDESILITPEGEYLEWDGDGSPLRALGLI